MLSSPVHCLYDEKFLHFNWITAFENRLLLLSYIDGLMQERRNSNALAMELCLSCTNPSIYIIGIKVSSFKKIRSLSSIKLTSCLLKNFHYKNKTLSWPSYIFYNGNALTWKDDRNIVKMCKNLCFYHISLKRIRSIQPMVPSSIW